MAFNTTFRYVDDMVFLAGTKEELWRILGIVRSETVCLRLELKPNMQVFPVEARGIDFLGYVFFHGYTLLRKSVKRKIFKRIAALRRGSVSEEAFMKSMASWQGWLKWCDSKRLSEKIENELQNIKRRKNNEDNLQ